MRDAILGLSLIFCHFILVMSIIHHRDESTQLPHAGPEPAARLRPGDGRAQPDPRRAQPGDDAAGGEQRAEPPARAAGRQAGGAQRLRRRADAARPGAVARRSPTRCASWKSSLTPGDFVASEARQHLRAGHGRRDGGRADAGPGGDHRARRARRLDARAAADHARPAPAAGRGADGPGRRLLPGGAGRPDGAGPAGRPGAVRPPAAVRRRVRLRDARRAIRWPGGR